jgi:hypothetical protein
MIRTTKKPRPLYLIALGFGAQAKEAEWADPSSKLRAKRSTRLEFDAWLDRQCQKAVEKKQQRQGPERQQLQRWAVGLKPPDLYEWFSNCYTMRCDDDYVWGGGDLHGPYDPDATTGSIASDFMVFCLLASRRAVVPPGWDWAAFLEVASQYVCYAFEKSDAKERWGGENVFSAMSGGRSLRYTAEMVYGKAMSYGADTHPDHTKAEKDVEQLCGGGKSLPLLELLYNEVGGREAWRTFETMLGEKRG